jgi:pyocin large subunit-like protein
MKDPKAETPPLTRAGRKAADAALAAAKFTPTSDGKSAVRKFEVHGMVVTEEVSAADVLAASSAPAPTPAVSSAPVAPPPLKELGPQTPPLTRAGRKVADATLAAAKFIPSSDGKGAVRRFEVHGIVVTEKISAANAIPSPPKPTSAAASKPSVEPNPSVPQTPPLSRAQRKFADATLAAAKFTRTSNGKSAIRMFEVHGMAVTELVSAENAVDAIKDKK